MDNKILMILLVLLIITCILYLTSCSSCKNIENFETYTYGPFNYRTTGSDPLSLYRYPVYREPFMYPYKFFSSYPTPYLTYWTNSI